MAYKTYNNKPTASFILLTPGDGHHIAGGNVRKALEETETRLSGFTMVGAYPIGNAGWNSQKGGEDTADFERVWSVPKPSADPVLGKSSEGLQGLWD